MKIILMAVMFGSGLVTIAMFSRGDGTNTPGTVSTQPGDTSPTSFESNPTVFGKKSVQREDYGKTTDGQKVEQFICKNDNGLVLKMITYGATVTSLEVPDRDGNMANITLSCPDIQGYEKCTSYFGASVGRFCNRIAKGKFEIDGKEYTLATNNDPNHLHGGDKGFDKVVWNAETIEYDRAVGVRFTYHSKDGEEGYPGNLDVSVVYLLTDNNELVVRFLAETDQTTPVNLTNHNYWNLAGAGSGKITDHILQVEADKYLETDDTLIPTGKLLDVKGSPLDFTTPTAIGDRIEQVGSDPKGYDHCFALRETDTKQRLAGVQGAVRKAALVKDPKSGRVMEIYTSEPGLQFYTGNFLDESEGSGGFAQHGAFCLEAQLYPDSPNHPEFPSTLIEPGGKYRHTTVHKFSTEK